MPRKKIGFLSAVNSKPGHGGTARIKFQTTDDWKRVKALCNPVTGYNCMGSSGGRLDKGSLTKPQDIDKRI
jgi:hypothetical protein